MRILIADDEYLARSTLRSMLEELDPSLDAIGEATNGEEMAAMVSQIFPEIAFVDIRMPKLNGLQAIKACRQISPRTRWFILTGFPEFEYAQEAIRIGVSGYLLKPVDPEELRKMLGDFTADSKKQKSSHNKQFEHELMALCYGLTSPEAEEPSGTNTAAHFIGAIISLDSTENEKRKAEQQLDFCSCVRSLIETRSDINNQIALLVLPNGEFATVGAWLPMSGNDGEKLVRSYFRELERASVQQDGNSVITLIGPAECHGYPQLLELLDQMQRLSCLRVVCGIGKQLSLAVLQEQASMPGQMELASQVFSLCQFYRDGSYLSYVKALQGLEKTLLAAAASTAWSKPVAGFLNDTLQCQLPAEASPQIWISILEQHGEPLLRETSRDEARGSDLIAQVTAFVDENFMRNIGIGQIAEQLNITPNYLSTLFHKKTGTNFMSYLTRTRMLKAKELLANPEVQIQQVAEQVGYISARHFARLFSEQFGCLPSEYRDSLKDG